jgi:hypothetical protein
MACTKSELISAINSFGAARATGDSNLIAFSGNLIGKLIETLEFDAEEEVVEDTEVKEAVPV